MSTKNWKNKELNSLLLEKWGFKFDLDKLNENFEEEEEVEEEELEEEKKPDADGDGIPDWADKEDNSEKEDLEEMCPPDHGHGGGAAMVIGDEAPENAGAPEGRAVELIDELRDILMQLTGGVGGEMEEEPMEEKRGRGRPGPHTRGEPDHRARGLKEAQIRQLVRTALKRVMEKKNG